MKRFLIHKVSSSLLIGACLVSCSRSPEAPGMLELWYRQPASEWTDALPIGNGRMGAMIFGGVSRDRIQFNEETFWTGGPEDANRPDAYRYLPEIRRLLFEGRQKEAEALAGGDPEVWLALASAWMDCLEPVECLRCASEGERSAVGDPRFLEKRLIALERLNRVAEGAAEVAPAGEVPWVARVAAARVLRRANRAEEARALDEVKKQSPATLATLSESMGMSKNQLQKLMNSLEERKLVKREGPVYHPVS